ncbi:hypothetical protein AB0O76_13450 [Streptomyces sp. NPDC086554]|uniref:hypothetical protein n=1 Tax=Streptomyces sp. NPDC086554 TaxID=3154864 RepID=UPI0034456D12
MYRPTDRVRDRGRLQHTPEFTAHGKTAGADRAVLDGATALALVGADLAASGEQRHRLRRGRRAAGPEVTAGAARHLDGRRG